MGRIRTLITIFLFLLLLSGCGSTVDQEVLERNTLQQNPWTYLQDVVNDSCSSFETTCTVQWNQPTTTHSTIMIVLWSKGFSGSPPKAVSIKMCTSNPCSTDTGGGTWVLHLPGAPFTIKGGNPTHSVDPGYNLNIGGGSTYLTFTRTAGTVSAWGLEALEFKCTGSICGTVTLDGIGNPGGGSNSCGTCTGSSFKRLSGSSDAIISALDCDYLPSNPSAPYILTSSTQWIYALSYSGTAAPTFIQTPAGQTIAPALAFSPYAIP